MKEIGCLGCDKNSSNLYKLVFIICILERTWKDQHPFWWKKYKNYWWNYISSSISILLIATAWSVQLGRWFFSLFYFLHFLLQMSMGVHVGWSLLHFIECPVTMLAWVRFLACWSLIITELPVQIWSHLIDNSSKF